eukprot:scaffold1299_cov331-Prasinococcus_capsulatus_cf.AAC.2
MRMRRPLQAQPSPPLSPRHWRGFCGVWGGSYVCEGGRGSRRASSRRGSRCGSRRSRSLWTRGRWRCEG